MVLTMFAELKRQIKEDLKIAGLLLVVLLFAALIFGSVIFEILKAFAIIKFVFWW